MKERPLLFSAPMVRALLDGSKTQTRRLANAAVDQDGAELRDTDGWPMRNTDAGEVRAACRYGAPGDRIWVKETHGIVEVAGDEVIVAYAANRRGQFFALKPGLEAVAWAAARVDAEHWRPSIFMPRWASRITLEITDVRVERLQAISEWDALCEGIVATHGGYGLPAGEHFHATDPRQSYFSLWEAINGHGSVAADPFVWVLSFRRI